MTSLKTFFRLFAANVTSDDVSTQPRETLFVRARNVVVVLRQRGTPEPELRTTLVELLADWQTSKVRTMLPLSDRFWFDSTQDEALLRELLERVVNELRKG